MGVEAGRDQDELGAELGGDRHDQLGERGDVLVVAGARGQRHVDGTATALAGADLAGRARPRVEGVLVRRDVEHAGIVVEAPLRPVAVMHVPIDDQQPLEAVACAQVARADGDVVEQAKAHGPIRLGVVAGRPNEREAVVDVARHDRVEDREVAAGGEARGLVRPRRRRGVGVEGEEPLPRRRHDPLDVLAAVIQRQLAGGRRPRPERDQPVAPTVGERLGYDPDALRALGMPWTGVVRLITRVENERGAHAAPRHTGPDRAGPATPVAAGAAQAELTPLPLFTTRERCSASACPSSW